MSEASKAIFLSYASQDAEAARCICEALRAVGVEVWFDQSELRASWASLQSRPRPLSCTPPTLGATIRSISVRLGRTEQIGGVIRHGPGLRRDPRSESIRALECVCN